jgi:hypothetical protein
MLSFGCSSGQKRTPQKPATHTEVAKPVDNTALLFEVTMRSVRMRETLVDPMGQPKDHVEWNTAHQFIQMTETDWVPVEKGDRKAEWRMYRYLLIPNAPWMRIGEDGAFIVAKAGGHAERIGEHDQWHPIAIPGQKQMTIMMWKTTATNGKWIGVVDDRVYESADNGTGSQIGWINFKNLTLETGETVLLFMTKGMAPGAVWEGDVKDTVYREMAEGKGTPVAKLSYRPFRLEDGTMSVLLMSRSLQGKAVWTGARNGKIVESADSN